MPAAGPPPQQGTGGHDTTPEQGFHLIEFKLRFKLNFNMHLISELISFSSEEHIFKGYISVTCNHLCISKPNWLNFPLVPGTPAQSWAGPALLLAAPQDGDTKGSPPEPTTRAEKTPSLGWLPPLHLAQN